MSHGSFNSGRHYESHNVQRTWNGGSRSFVTIMMPTVSWSCSLVITLQVSTEEAKSFSEREKLVFIETSALDAINVEEGFVSVLTQIYNNVTSS